MDCITSSVPVTHAFPRCLSSVQFQDGIYAFKKAHMHSASVQFRMVFMHSKKPICTQVQFSSRWYLCTQKNPYALHPVSHSLRDVCGMCHMLLCQFINTVHFPRCLRDILVDCVTVYVQMHFLLLKGAVSGWQQLAVRRHHGTDQAVCGPGRI